MIALPGLRILRLQYSIQVPYFRTLIFSIFVLHVVTNECYSTVNIRGVSPAIDNDMTKLINSVKIQVTDVQSNFVSQL
jgi:hypothetical protein